MAASYQTGNENLLLWRQDLVRRLEGLDDPLAANVLC
jgi:hypothetical protein